MTWQDLIGYENDYEIFTEYPHQIRKKSNNRIVSEYLKNDGYYRINLNGENNLKHRLIALQFIPNPNNLPYVDHKNKHRDDNRIENLRWVSRSTNMKNRSGHIHGDYNIIDYDNCPDDLIIVKDYGKHEFEDYYYSPELNRFYFDSGVDLRELHINFDKRNGSAFVYTRNIYNKQVKICFTKFKRLYGLNF